MIDQLPRYPDYQPSGVPWLGHVPSHWTISRSKRVFSQRKDFARPDDVQLSATQAYGVIPQAEFEARERRRVVRISMHLDKRRHVERDDFVISMRSFQGGLERAWASGAIRSSYVVLKPASGVDVGYFAYLFKSHGYIKALQSTADFIRDGQDLNFGNFCQVDLPLPPLEDQRAVARFLDYANRRIERYIRGKRKLIALLNEQKQAIIHRAVTRGLDPNVPMKDSGVPWLGEIPTDWEFTKLKHVSPQITVGIVIQPARLYVAQGVPCLRSLNISSGTVSVRDMVFINEDSNRANKKSQLRAGDVVLVRTGRTGIAVVVPSEFDGANCVDLLIVRQSRRLRSEYLVAYLQSHGARSEVAYNSVGALQAHYNAGTLRNLRIPLPSVEEQDALLGHVRRATLPLVHAVNRAEREIALMREYRTRLVSDVVTGQLDVREAARNLPDLAPDVTAVAASDIEDDADPSDDLEGDEAA